MINFVDETELARFVHMNENDLAKYKDLLINAPRKIHYHNYVFALNYKKLMDKFIYMNDDGKQKFIKEKIRYLFCLEMDEDEREAIVNFIQDVTDSTCFDWLLTQ